MLSIPTTSEYAPFYSTYIEKVGTGHVLELLESQLHKTRALFEGLSEKSWGFRYAKGKWTIAEVLMHIIETEMVMLNRALRISRKDPEPLAGMDQEHFIQHAHTDEIAPQNLINAYVAVRRTSLAMAHLITPEQYMNTGIAWKYSVSVRALFYIIAGHEQHHLQILDEKYLGK